jgi:hypothetical protein
MSEITVGSSITNLSVDTSQQSSGALISSNITYAGVWFDFILRYIGVALPIDIIPVSINARGTAEAFASATGDYYTSAWATASIYVAGESNSASAICTKGPVTSSCDIPSASFSIDTLLQIQPNVFYAGSLSATAGYSLISYGDPAQGSVQGISYAFVDPTIMIDPTFPDRSNYVLEFNRNIITTTSVPEPPTVLLFSSGLLSLFGMKKIYQVFSQPRKG